MPRAGAHAGLRILGPHHRYAQHVGLGLAGDIAGRDAAANVQAHSGALLPVEDFRAAGGKGVTGLVAGKPARLEFLTSKEQAVSLYPVGSTD